MPQSGKAKEVKEEGTLSSRGDVGLVSHRGEESDIFQITASSKREDKHCQIGRFLCLGQLNDSSQTWCELCNDHYGGCWDESKPCQGEMCQYDIDTDTGDNYYAKDGLDHYGGCWDESEPC